MLNILKYGWKNSDESVQNRKIVFASDVCSAHILTSGRASFTNMVSMQKVADVAIYWKIVAMNVSHTKVQKVKMKNNIFKFWKLGED